MMRENLFKDSLETFYLIEPLNFKLLFFDHC